MSNAHPPVYSVDQAAELLGCSRRRVFQLLADGTLERAPRYGRQIRIQADTVLQALARPAPPKQRKARVPKHLGPPVINRANVRI